MPRERNTRENAREGSQGGRRPARSTNMAMYVPILLAAVIVAGIGLAILADKQPEEKPVVASAPKRDPFADVPPEAPPTKTGGSSKYTFVSKAPDGLTNDENWKAATKIAAEGELLFQEATQAKAAGDVPLLNSKGREARDKLTTAVEMTAAWEEELLEKYGDGNLQVREIMKVRTGWIDKMRWLHKSAAL